MPRQARTISFSELTEEQLTTVDGDLITEEEANDRGLILYDGGIWFEDDWEDNSRDCYSCAGQFHEEDMVEDYHGDMRCETCSEQRTFICDDCNERFPNHDRNTVAGGNHICDGCRDDYNTCDECGDLHHYENGSWDEDEDSWYCYDCQSSAPDRLHSYNYRLTPEFYSVSDEDEKRGAFFGVELEMDEGGYRRFTEVLEVINADNEIAIGKQDGSLNNGFELVTHPCTYEYHATKIPWKEALKTASSIGYRSHQGGTCGLHIHISRKAFGENISQQEMNITKLLYLFEKFWNEIKKFSRRTDSQIQRWAQRYGLIEPLEQLLDTAKQAGRYTAINLTNRHTVEVRLFRGTLKYETFIATLQFTNLIFDTVMNHHIDELRRMTWQEFCEQGSHYQEFQAYLEVRGLLREEVQDNEGIQVAVEPVENQLADDEILPFGEFRFDEGSYQSGGGGSD